MARKRPTIAPVVYENVQYEFVAVDIGEQYEGECPQCSATLFVENESLSFHRNGTFSTLSGHPAVCGGCDLALRVDRGMATSYIGPRAERTYHDFEDERAWTPPDAA